MCRLMLCWAQKNTIIAPGRAHGRQYVTLSSCNSLSYKSTVGHGIAIEELCHGYTNLECNQCIGGYPFSRTHIYTHTHTHKMMLISMSFRIVTDKYTKDNLFMKLEDYNVFMRRFAQMASVHYTSLFYG